MIRSGLLIGVLSALAVGTVFAQRPSEAPAADPPRSESRRQTLVAAAEAADRELVRLQDAVQVAIEHGRQASARTVAGEASPAEPYEAAARAAEDAAPLATSAADAVSRLRGTRAAMDPHAEPLPSGPAAVDLLSVASQLREAAPKAAAFVALRRAAARTLDALDDALAALDAERPEDALSALDEADAARGRVAEWEDPPAVLPVWLGTTEEVISAARGIAEATLAGDTGRAEQAVAAYRRAIEGARQADVALALAISETGAGVAGTPLRRLADAAAAVAAQRGAVASLLQAGT